MSHDQNQNVHGSVPPPYSGHDNAQCEQTEYPPTVQQQQQYPPTVQQQQQDPPTVQQQQQDPPTVQQQQPQPQTTVTVIQMQPQMTTEVSFGDQPVQMMCSICGAQIITQVNYEVGTYAWLWCCGICVGLTVIGAPFGCCFIPFCVNSCSDTTHSCPNCHSKVGSWQRC